MRYTRMAHIRHISEKVFNRIAQTMSTEVSIPTSGRYNAMYDLMDLHAALIELAISNGYAESGMKRLSLEAGCGGGRVPSGSWLRKMVEKVPEGNMEAMLDAALSSSVGKLREHGLFIMPVMAAIDKHGIPRYDPNLDRGFLVRGGRPGRGTDRHEVYITMQSVEEGRRAQLACIHAGALDDNEELITELVNSAGLDGVDVSLLLMDREFYSTAVVVRLNKLHQHFLMPCRMTPGIRAAMEEFRAGKRPTISNYIMRSGRGETADIRLIIVRGNKGLIPLATNLSIDRVIWNVSRLPAEYSMRWGIETGYAEVEGLRARTTSRNHSLRLLLFYYSMVLYNAWLLANLMMAEKFFRRLLGPIIPMAVLKGALHVMIVNSFSRG